MGNRITIDGDGEHPSATPTDRGYWHSFARYKFVKKLASEVGDGTAWPMLVSRDQLAEIMYRVRDARLQGDIYSLKHPEAETGFDSHFYFSGDPTPELSQFYAEYGFMSSSLQTGSRRGFTVKDKTGFENYYGGAYSSGGTTFYDILSNEIGTWIDLPPPVPSLDSHGPFLTGLSTTLWAMSNLWSGPGGDFAHPPTFYRAERASTFYSDLPPSYSNSPINARVNFSGDVAWIDDDGSGNPTSAGNRLFVGVEVVMETFRSINDNNYSGTIPFEVELSGQAVLTFPLYYDISPDTVSGSVRLKATEWWPYATKAGVNAWTPTTGAPANGGPAA